MKKTFIILLSLLLISLNVYGQESSQNYKTVYVTNSNVEFCFKNLRSGDSFRFFFEDGFDISKLKEEYRYFGLIKDLHRLYSGGSKIIIEGPVEYIYFTGTLDKKSLTQIRQSMEKSKDKFVCLDVSDCFYGKLNGREVGFPKNCFSSHDNLYWLYLGDMQQENISEGMARDCKNLISVFVWNERGLEKDCFENSNPNLRIYGDQGAYYQCKYYKNNWNLIHLNDNWDYSQFVPLTVTIKPSENSASKAQGNSLPTIPEDKVFDVPAEETKPSQITDNKVSVQTPSEKIPETEVFDSVTKIGNSAEDSESVKNYIDSKRTDKKASEAVSQNNTVSSTDNSTITDSVAPVVIETEVIPPVTVQEPVYPPVKAADTGVVWLIDWRGRFKPQKLPAKRNDFGMYDYINSEEFVGQNQDDLSQLTVLKTLLDNQMEDGLDFTYPGNYVIITKANASNFDTAYASRIDPVEVGKAFIASYILNTQNYKKYAGTSDDAADPFEVCLEGEASHKLQDYSNLKLYVYNEFDKSSGDGPLMIGIEGIIDGKSIQEFAVLRIKRTGNNWAVVNIFNGWLQYYKSKVNN